MKDEKTSYEVVFDSSGGGLQELFKPGTLEKSYNNLRIRAARSSHQNQVYQHLDPEDPVCRNYVIPPPGGGRPAGVPLRGPKGRPAKRTDKKPAAKPTRKKN